jgi:hypothetical protein
MREVSLRFATPALALAALCISGTPLFGQAQEDLAVVARFDKDQNGRLDNAERQAARQWLQSQYRGRGGGGGRYRGYGSEGVKLTSGQVRHYTTESLYDEKVLRTIFIRFQNPDWERELMDFYRTDVEVPADITVDGKLYPQVGVHFRGNSSFRSIPETLKHSINLSMDFVHGKQRLLGYKTLNLLNANEDPSLIRAVMYSYISRQYYPAPKANMMRVVINGENWGVYENVQQFNGDFLKEATGSKEGARWKVPGRSPGGLIFLGENVSTYRYAFELKSKEDPQAWAALIKLCRVLNSTPPAQLQNALNGLLDVDGALRFLALDKALLNSDGYWSRASDYAIYRDANGVFHVIPHDTNETLRASMVNGGGGFGNVTGSSGMYVDPYDGAGDPQKALLYRLLAVPALEARYLSYMRDIAEKWMDWNRIGPVATQFHNLIAADARMDTHKLESTALFEMSLDGDPTYTGRDMSLKGFFDQRRAYLLNHPDVKSAARLPAR